MGWKRERFKRRIRELSAEVNGDGRTYPPLDEVEGDCAYNCDYIWRCLSRAWKIGRAMGRSPLRLQNEAEEWLAEIGARKPGVVSQAFLDVKVGHRVWNSKCEASRFQIASDVFHAAEPEQEGDELPAWYSDIVAEWADIYKMRSLPDANHALIDWTETEAVLPRLWSLYENGPRATNDRNTLKALVVSITNSSGERAEAWVSAKERMEGHAAGKVEEDQN